MRQIILDTETTGLEPAEGHRAPLDALQLLESKGQLKQRVFVSWDWKTTLNLAYTVEDIEAQIQNRAKYQSDLVRPNYVKIFADGSPGKIGFINSVSEPFCASCNRIRMTAEEIRDNTLHAAGVLRDQVGGPPVYPYQPKGLWLEGAGNRDWSSCQASTASSATCSCRACSARAAVAIDANASSA